MSYEVLAMMMALLAIVLGALIARATWMMLPRRAEASSDMVSGAVSPAIKRRDAETGGVEDDPAETPSLALTRLPAARPTSERRRKIGPADAGRAEPGPVERMLNSGVHGDILFRLEQSFSLLETGRISLETYLVELEALRRGCMMEAERLRQMGDSPRPGPERLGEMRQDIADALAAVEWCMGWAEDQLCAARDLPGDPMNDTGPVPA